MISKIILLLIILFVLNYMTSNKLLGYLKDKIQLLTNINNNTIQLLDYETSINILSFFKLYFKNKNIVIMNKLYYIQNNNNKYFYNIIINNNNNLHNVNFIIDNDNKIKITNMYQLYINDNNNNNDDDDIPSIISLSD